MGNPVLPCQGVWMFYLFGGRLCWMVLRVQPNYAIWLWQDIFWVALAFQWNKFHLGLKHWIVSNNLYKEKYILKVFAFDMILISYWSINLLFTTFFRVASFQSSNSSLNSNWKPVISRTNSAWFFWKKKYFCDSLWTSSNFNGISLEHVFCKSSFAGVPWS